MNRNVESHFSTLPSVDIPRSIFNRSSGHKTTFNCGDLIPIYWDEILPGDTVNMTTSVVARLQTLLSPIMDNIYIETFWFYCRNSILWDKWEQFFGENKDQAWIPNSPPSMPTVSYPAGGFASGTIADYLGVPVGYANLEADRSKEPIALPFRAYAKICDEWFRDQNVSDPLLIPTDSTRQTGSNGSNYITDVVNGGMPFKASRFHDYFSSCLPAPQRAAPVEVSFASLNDLFPVGTSTDHGIIDEYSADVAYPLHMRQANNLENDTNYYFRQNWTTPGDWTGATSASVTQMFPSNLWAKIDYESSITINDLRVAFQTQKFYEKMALGGARYREIILEMFGVRTPDQRLMIPEYLGGHRFPLSIHQVANTSESESSFLGDLGAMSNTSDVHADFIRSFSEPGILMCVAVCRYDSSYSQGICREFLRRDKLDYYWPVFNSIGNTPVYTKELDIRAGGDQVFGFQECFAEYRYKPNRISGEMRPDIQNSLATWHLGDYYGSTDGVADVPTLSDSWMRMDKSNLDRCLSVTSAVSNQILGDFWFECFHTRPLPMFGIPGLVDHF